MLKFALTSDKVSQERKIEIALELVKKMMPVAVEHSGQLGINQFLEGALRRAGIGTEVKAEANGHTNGNGRI